MNDQSEAKETASKKAVGKHHGKPPGQWCLRLDPEMRKSAQEFFSAMLRIEPVEEGEFPEPTITPLTVRLQFASPLQGSRAEELIQMIGAASEKNIAEDGLFLRQTNFRLKSLATRVRTEQNKETQAREKLKWENLLERITGAMRSIDELGEPPYQSPENTSADMLPDFKTIWRERKRYTDRLPEFEQVDRCLRAEFDRLKIKKSAPPRYAGILPPLEIESAGREVEISARDLLGGPLAGWVCQIGDSVSHTESLSKDPRWRELALAYCELHLKSGLLDYAPVGIEGGPENPFWDAARELLSNAQQHLLEFLNAACEVDSPPAGVEPVPKAKGHRDKKEKAKPAVSTNEKPARKKVSVERVGKSGSELEVLIDGKLLGNKTTTSKKVLLAACVFQFRPATDGWWKTSRLMKLVLNKTEHENLGERSAVLLNRWKGSLRLATEIDLETNESGRSFRVTGVVFDTRLTPRVIAAALSRFSEKCPIEIRKPRIDRA